MKVYIDIVFSINYIYDFIILLSSSLILKRNTSIFRILLGSLFGTLTLLILFIRINNVMLMLYKIIISIFIILITFGYKDIRYFFKNIYHFYLIGIIIGGLLYFVNNQFSYNMGLVFFNNYKINFILGIVISVVGIIIYLNNIKSIKYNYNKYKKVTIYFDDYKIDINAFVDTGNKLVDPYLFRPIILVNKEMIKNYDKTILVPYKTCGNEGLLTCIKANKIYIDGIGYKKNFLVGITNKINIDGIGCLLNEKLMED